MHTGLSSWNRAIQTYIQMHSQEMAGTVGPPLPCTAFRLEAVPEMKYDPCAPHSSSLLTPQQHPGSGKLRYIQSSVRDPSPALP